MSVNKKSFAVFLVVLGAAIQLISAQEATPPVIQKAGSAEYEISPERFDYLVREDFFTGLGGDRKAFDRAMKLCEDTLGKNPQHAAAMVWHGAGVIFMAGKAFQSKEIAKGIDLWQRGLKEMNDAVALQPDNINILIPRGATLLPASRHGPDPAASKAMLQTGVADYEKVLQQQKPNFQKLSTHAKGELLSGLADGWYRLGDLDKSRAYLRQITRDCAGSAYAVRASDWLETKDSSALQQKSKTMSCIGCHHGP
jgi:hypothetical protein